MATENRTQDAGHARFNISTKNKTESAQEFGRYRTKGRVTRAVKKALIPGYGKKGMGWLHPKRKLYNTIYKKTTFSLFDLFK